MLQKVPVDKQTITKNTNKTDGNKLAVEKEEQKHVVRVATTTTLQPRSEAPVLVNTNTGVMVQVDSYTPLG